MNKIIVSCVILGTIICSAETMEKDIQKLILEGAKKQLKTKAYYTGETAIRGTAPNY